MTMMKDNCEWCQRHYWGAPTCFTFDQDFLNEIIGKYNRSNANGQAKLWALMQRSNEWPKVGDKRGMFCSERCRLEALDKNFLGSWHSRYWFW